MRIGTFGVQYVRAPCASLQPDLRIGVLFVDEFAQQFDTHVQAHILLLSNPFTRAFARVLLHFFA